MSYGLERLKEIGAQKIHERTHISREHLQALLHGSFDSFNKIHFLGFISILEREYDVDLSDLKAKGLAHFQDTSSQPRKFNNIVFSQKRRKKSNLLRYFILALIVFGAFAYFKLIPSMEEKGQITPVDNTIIANAQKNLEPVVEADAEDTNETQLEALDEYALDTNTSDTNVTENTNKISSTVTSAHASTAEISKNEALKTVASTTEVLTTEPSKAVNSLKIIPKSKVWMGYIEIKTNKRHQKSFDEALELNASKDWLFLFGHGNVTIELNGKVQEFSSSKSVRFKYIDGILSEISNEEFKELNKDRKW